MKLAEAYTRAEKAYSLHGRDSARVTAMEQALRDLLPIVQRVVALAPMANEACERIEESTEDDTLDATLDARDSAGNVLGFLLNIIEDDERRTPCA